MKRLSFTIAILVGGLALMAQEPGGEHEKPGKPGSPREVRELMAQLEKSVDGEATVHNVCHVQAQDVDVEESTGVTELRVCKLTFTTRKISTGQSGRREVDFAIYADLAELTTPAVVEARTFPQCEPVKGSVTKLTARAMPGKKLRVLRRTMTEAMGGDGKKVEPEAEISRGDMSFFFSDPVAARKAANALDRAVRACGGTEWPDEDDLP